MRLAPRILCLLQALLLVAQPIHAHAQMETIAGTPEGFEALTTPRPTRVMLYYGGQSLGAFAAHATPTSIRFDDVDAVMKAIPNIRDKAAVSEVLRQPMPAHADALCTPKRQTDCGKLTPQIAAVIYDENTLNAELFIHRDYLSVTEDNAPRYLPHAQKEFSSVYSFNGAASGVVGQGGNVNVANDAIFALGEAKLATQTSAGDEGLRFDTAAVSAERDGWAAGAGLFRSRAMQLVSDRDMAGVSVGTSLRTRLDAHKTEGNRIIVYLPRRAFVSIYREGRLYSSRAYEAGNQQLDTTELPEGAYTITLRIQEPDGSTREETRFFAKNAELPPADAPFYYAEAGLIREPAETDAALPQITGKPILRAGTVRRVTDNMGLSGSVLGVADRAMAEGGAFWLFEDSQLTATALSSSKGDAGLQFGFIKNNDRIGLAIDARRLWLADSPIPGYEDFTGDIAQAAATVSYMASMDVTLGARASYSAQDKMADSYSIGPYAEWRMWQEGESMLSASADFARIDRRNEGNVMLRFSHRIGSYGASGAVGAGFGNGIGPTGSARVWHDNQQPGSHLLVGGGISGDRKNRVVSGDAEWRNNFGQWRGGVQQGFGEGGATTSYGGNFAFNAAQVDDEFHLGGEQTDRSAVVVATDGDAKGREMVVFVNGTARSTVPVGGRRVVYLPPFQTYRIRVAPKKAGLLDYEAGEKPVTLYPGNVTRLEWQVNHFYVVAARVVDEHGKPLANATLEGSRNQTATSESGRLQAEVAKPELLTFTTSHGTRCMANLPQQQPVNGVLLFREPVVCREQRAN